MPKIKNTLIVSSSLMFCWIIFEILIEFNYKKKIKNQLKKFINLYKIDKYKSYYTNNFSIIASEINNIKDDERVHTQNTLKKTFLKRSTSNLSSLINQLELFKRSKYTNIRYNIFWKTNFMVSLYLSFFIFIF